MSMVRFFRIHALTATALGAVLLATPTVAEARVHTGPDPRGDVVKFGEESETVVRVPARANGDIVSTVFRHTNSRIRIRFNFADLRPQLLYAFFDLQLATDEGLKRWVDLTIAPGQRAGVVSMWQLGRNGFDMVACSAHREVDYAANVVIIGMPRKCLSNPHWVRIGADTRTRDPNDATAADPSLFVDQAMEGAVADDEDRLAMSPRLYRGNRGPSHN